MMIAFLVIYLSGAIGTVVYISMIRSAQRAAEGEPGFRYSDRNDPIAILVVTFWPVGLPIYWAVTHEKRERREEFQEFVRKDAQSGGDSPNA